MERRQGKTSRVVPFHAILDYALSEAQPAQYDAQTIGQFTVAVVHSLLLMWSYKSGF